MRNNLTLSGIFFIAVVVLSVFCSCAFAAEKLTKISDNVYAYVDTKDSSKDNSFGANAGVIIGENGIVVIDTLTSAKQAKHFIRDIRSISRKPIKYVINTHYHLDHSFGNCEFAKLGAVIIAQENDKKAMEQGAEETLRNIESYGFTPEDIRGTKPAYPVLTYSSEMGIDLGNEKIKLIHARHSHTDGDTIVYLPAQKILFAGDVLFTGYHPFLAEGNIEEWVKELDDINKMAVEKIIPGHGPVSSKKDLDDMRAYIILFDLKAKELAKEFDDAQEIAEEMRKVLPKRPEGQWLIVPNILMKYAKKQNTAQ